MKKSMRQQKNGYIPLDFRGHRACGPCSFYATGAETDTGNPFSVQEKRIPYVRKPNVKEEPVEKNFQTTIIIFI